MPDDYIQDLNDEAQAAPTPSSMPEEAPNPPELEALMQIRRAVSQCLLFPLGTPQYDKVTQAVYDALTAAISTCGKYYLGIAGGRVIVNGVPLEIPKRAVSNVEYLEKAFTAACTTSINFEAGVEKEELGLFLSLLARKQLGGTDGAKINANLRSQNITHVSVNELRYVALGAAERVISSNSPDAMAGQNVKLSAALTELLGSLGGLLGNAAGDVSKAQLRDEMAEQLLDKDPEMLSSLLHAISRRGGELPPGAPGQLIAGNPPDQAVIDDIAGIASDLEAAGLPHDNPAWDRPRRMFDRTLAAYAGRAEQLNNVQFPPQVEWLLPAWLSQVRGALASGSAADRLPGILGLSPLSLLDGAAYKTIVDMLDEFAVAGMNEEAEYLTAHIAGALKSPARADREKAVSGISKLLDQSMDLSAGLSAKLEDALLDSCKNETSPNILRLLANCFASRAARHHKIGDYARATEYINWIERIEAAASRGLVKDTAEFMRPAREALGAAFARSAVEDITGGGERANSVIRAAKYAGQLVWSQIIHKIGTENSSAMLEKYGKIISDAGHEAIIAMEAAMGNLGDSPEFARLAAVSLSYVMDDEVWGRVAYLLKKEDPARHLARAYVRKVAPEVAVKAVAACLKALEESNGAQRDYILQTLAEIKHESALPELMKLLPETINPGQDEAPVLSLLEALSRRDDPAMAAPLCKLIMLRGTPKSVIIAAIRAVGRQPRHISVSDMTMRMKMHKDPEIARAAENCSKGVTAAELAEADKHRAEAVVVAPAAPARSGGTLVRRRHFDDMPKAPALASATVATPGAATASPTPRPSGHVIRPPSLPPGIHLAQPAAAQAQPQSQSPFTAPPRVNSNTGFVPPRPVTGQTNFLRKASERFPVASASTPSETAPAQPVNAGAVTGSPAPGNTRLIPRPGTVLNIQQQPAPAGASGGTTAPNAQPMQGFPSGFPANFPSNFPAQYYKPPSSAMMAAVHEAGQRVSMSGKLEDIGLPGVLRLVGNRNGVLALNVAGGQGSLMLCGQKIVSAAYKDLTDQIALETLVTFRYGTYNFYARECMPPGAWSYEYSNIETLQLSQFRRKSETSLIPRAAGFLHPKS